MEKWKWITVLHQVYYFIPKEYILKLQFETNVNDKSKGK